jgi:hypothetical protein
MSGDEGLEKWLAELETRSYGSVDEASTDMAELLVWANRQIEIELHGTSVPDWDSLREIIRRALAFVRKVATEFGAAGYSIGVSIPPGLEASVEWEVK